MNRIIFFFILINSMPLGAQSTGSKVFESVKGRVMQVKVAQDLNAPKASYGSGFSIHHGGLIMTNYHVISQALIEPEKYNAYVIIDGKPIEAEIVDIDVTHDLALIKIEKQFDKILSISSTLSTKGSKTFSLGLPKDLNLSIVEGTYNGLIKRGVYEEIHMSSAINSGMSGGPTVNSKGEVIGVNVSTLLFSQNISFAVPIKFAQALLDKFLKTEKNLELDRFYDYVQTQLHQTQKVLSDDLMAIANTRKIFNGWEVDGVNDYIKCWQSGLAKEDVKQYDLNKNICRINSATRVSDKISSGHYAIHYSLFKNIKLNAFQFYHLVYTNLESATDSSGLFYGQIKDKRMTKFDCRHEYLLNPQAIPFKINYCLQGYYDIEGLYNVYVTGVSLSDPTEILQVDFDLTGFTINNIKNIMTKIFSNIRKD